MVHRGYLLSLLQQSRNDFNQNPQNQKTLRNGIADRRGSPDSSFCSHGSPRVVKNCPISICGCNLPPWECGHRDFTLTSRQMFRGCLHIFDRQITRLGPFKNCHGDPRFHFQEFSTRILINVFSGCSGLLPHSWSKTPPKHRFFLTQNTA